MKTFSCITSFTWKCEWYGFKHIFVAIFSSLLLINSKAQICLTIKFEFEISEQNGSNQILN